MSLVTIIIPAYNASSYVSEAIESILSQSHDDWELLLVDDGSSDGTGEIAERYAVRDSRIRVFHRENGGMSAARNEALPHARGEYLTFLDSDDTMHPEFISATLRTMRESGADIICTGFRAYRGKEPRWETSVGKQGVGEIKLYGATEAVEACLYQKGGPDCSVWGKLYRRELWEGIRFRPGTGYEDLDIFAAVWLRARKIAVSRDEMIHYRRHGRSYLNTFNLGRADVLDVTDRLLRSAEGEETGVLPESGALAEAARVRRFAAHFNILILLTTNRTSREEAVAVRELRRRCQKVIIKDGREVVKNSRSRLKDRIGGVLGWIFSKTCLKT